jgi:hypothetical protein
MSSPSITAIGAPTSGFMTRVDVIVIKFTKRGNPQLAPPGAGARVRAMTGEAQVFRKEMNGHERINAKNIGRPISRRETILMPGWLAIRPHFSINYCRKDSVVCGIDQAGRLRSYSSGKISSE